jgi:serine/threonine-protein kinase
VTLSGADEDPPQASDSVIATDADGGAPAPRALTAQQVLDGLRARFELGPELGRGSFGVVWRARERHSRRDVALKVLYAEDALEPRRLERFRREGEVTAGLTHPSIVKVHGAGDVEGVPWLAYELIDGATTLGQALPRLDRAARVRLVLDVARALGHAHARGVVHRDVKPDNVLVHADGRARLADFGLAAAQGQARITRSGAMIGTPQFMSPEQFAGKRDDIGPASDVWATGVVLYQALTGELPFRGATVMELGAAIQSATPRAPRALDPTVPAALEAICLKALAREPQDRYPDGDALAHDLAAFLEGRPVSASALSSLRPRARRAARLGALALLPAVALAAGVLFALNAPRHEPQAQGGGPPALRLDAPEDGALVWESTVRVKGSAVAGGGGPTRVTVSVEGAPGRPRELALGPDGAFEATLALRPGENRVVVTAVDAEAGRAAVALTIRRGDGPAWYALLADDRRPPYPLPEGLDWGRAPGEYVAARDGSVFVWVPPGTFRMGDEERAFEQESAWPAHDVVITRGFFIGKTEVTWAQYRRYASATRSWLPTSVFPAGDDHPVHTVSWSDAQAYCAWAGARLPTEAEWEYAARGTDGRRHPWGPEQADARRANLQGEDIYAYTSPVGSFPGGASPFGCLDMVGNVWEWVNDRFAAYEATVAIDPTGPDAPNDPRTSEAPVVLDHRVNRGAAWNSPLSDAATSRGDAEASYRGTSIGFRLAR